MLKKSRMVLFSTLLLLLSITVAACGNGPTGGNGGTPTSQQTYNYKTPTNKGGTVLFSDWQFPSSTNLWFNTDVVGTEVDSGLWGAPLAITSDGKIIPDELSEVPSVQNGDVSKDGLTVTMKLNPNLKWSDGQPITADDFIYWWTVNEDPASGAASTSGFDQITTMTASDPHTLVLHYKQVFAPFLFFLPFAAPKHAWSSIANKDLQNTQSVNLTPTVTSGPYVVQDYASGQSFTMVPNKYYTSTKLHPAVLDKVIFKGYQSKDALIAGFQAGETDHAENFTLGDLPKLNNLPGLQISPGVAYEHLDFNLSKSYLQDVNVRKAIFQAIDRCQIIQSLLNQPCNTLILNDLEPCPHPDCAPNIQGYAFDVNAAKQDMKAAGWDCSKAPTTPCTKDGQPFPTLQLVTTSGNTLRQNNLEIIKDDLATLGIPSSFDGGFYPNTTLFADYASDGILATGQYDLALFGYVEGLDSDGNLYFAFHSSQIPTAANPAGQNFEHLNDPHLDDLLTQARSIVDQQKRSDLYKQAQAYMIQQALELPLYQKPNITMTDSRVGNYFPNPFSAGNEWNLGEWYKTTAQ